jgi:hypothetical protein
LQFEIKWKKSIWYVHLKKKYKYWRKKLIVFPGLSLHRNGPAECSLPTKTECWPLKDYKIIGKQKRHLMHLKKKYDYENCYFCPGFNFLSVTLNFRHVKEEALMYLIFFSKPFPPIPTPIAKRQRHRGRVRPRPCYSDKTFNLWDRRPTDGGKCRGPCDLGLLLIHM